MFKRLAIFFLPLLWAITASAQVREFTVYEDRVLDAYLAYYGRPADPVGLEFWADRLEAEGGNLDSIIEEFGESQEYQDRFGSLTNTQLVTNLYDQLFGREPQRPPWTRSCRKREGTIARIPSPAGRVPVRPG